MAENFVADWVNRQSSYPTPHERLKTKLQEISVKYSLALETSTPSLSKQLGACPSQVELRNSSYAAGCPVPTNGSPKLWLRCSASSRWSTGCHGSSFLWRFLPTVRPREEVISDCCYCGTATWKMNEKRTKREVVAKDLARAFSSCARCDRRATTCVTRPHTSASVAVKVPPPNSNQLVWKGEPKLVPIFLQIGTDRPKSSQSDLPSYGR